MQRSFSIFSTQFPLPLSSQLDASHLFPSCHYHFFWFAFLFLYLFLGFSFSTWIIQLTLNLHATFHSLCMKTWDYGTGHLVLLIPPVPALLRPLPTALLQPLISHLGQCSSCLPGLTTQDGPLLVCLLHCSQNDFCNIAYCCSVPQACLTFWTPCPAACQVSLSFTISRILFGSHPLCQWCHPTISSSVVPFSSCLQSFPASGSFPMSWLFASGGQNIGASALVLPMNIQCWLFDLQDWLVWSPCCP